ncbi:hypothetical protein TSUD_56670 [Trifolium subterraneum]|uniref:Reverse transcriptase domain-containing protein n=1 Tax=Trifolium subterraneum TaxID=3900 RepID=A0A2Z6NHB8_TRISU|nr:hypothetical protein TSUD_56670 [Trifolium subterraneum]
MRVREVERTAPVFFSGREVYTGGVGGGGGDQGWVSEKGWEDGEWTVVQRRRRKERRQADRGFDGERRHRHHRSRSTSTLRLSFLHDCHNHDGFHHHHNARSHSRRTMMPGGFRQRELGLRQPREFHEKNFSSSGFVKNTSSSSAMLQVFGGLDSLGSVSKRYVSFYFTNFPAQLSRFYLRKGFEVCGMLEDVYVAKKLNKFGAPYGFVKFSNVRDVNKLSKALNAVYFGHFRVRARVARFDRNVATEERSSGRVKVGHKVRCIGPEEVANLVEEGKASVVPAKGGTGTTEDVCVGDIVVRIGTPQEPTARKDAQVQEAGLILRKPSASSGVVKEKDDRILMRNFRTMPDDVLWAQNGLVATVINGEAVPVVQNRITDAGFHDLLIIPMRAEKVFIRSTAGADVLTIVNSAKDFFTLVFSNWTRWGKEVATYRRGAWVRLYGIPIHAWNVNFFKLCVFYCGRFLRADSVSADRDRLDFARVLIATPDLEIINREESESEASHTDNDMEHIDPDIRRDVDMVVGKLVDELAEEDDPVLQENHAEHITPGFLLSEDWCLTWPYCKHEARMRGASLKEWHMTHTKNLPSRIDSLKVRQSCLDQKGEEDVLSEAELEELHGVTSDIHIISLLHASICWQQSRSLWLKEGDSNSKYFHSVLASRRRGNAISSIVADGVPLEGVSSVRQAVVSHFAAHFKTSNVVRPRVDDLLFNTLNQVECSSLIKPFTRDEGEVMRFIVEFHRNGKLTKGLNSTFIALIPKVDSPQRLNDFRPISLVGCLYKILAKVLANRLRQVIGSVISESQTTFVKDRQILDGILIANELVDEARRSKKELMLFKVDFEKAYDSVDWGYLDAVMGRMSFPNLWRKWIKECVCTATASVLVNGSPMDEFPLERGLRQGDPLSPFLFLLAAEGLNVLMKTMVECNLFSGYSVGDGASTSISHLQFADDTLFMLVGVNIPESWLGEAASALRCRVGKIPFIYLGLPVGGDPRRLGFWEPVLARLKNRLSGWKSRFLSFGGRLVLLKSVLTSLPVYALSFFKAPSGKWCWRMLVDREGLWYRVLVARYGVERGRLRDGGRRGSSWWREIARIRYIGGGTGGAWFGECIAKKVGDGKDTLFWSDPWVEGLPLCERFRRLFDLAETQLCSVAEMASLGWGAGGRRGCGGDHSWLWQPDPDNGYSVRSAYYFLTSQDSVTLHSADGLIWHPQIPLKVSILAWRLLRDRLPTKANLVTRGILSSEAHFCVSGCGAVESAQHLFLSCSTFGPLWSMVALGGVALLCNSYGLLAFGLYGMSEIPDVLAAQQIHYSTCWTRSRIIPIGG